VVKWRNFLKRAICKNKDEREVEEEEEEEKKKTQRGDDKNIGGYGVKMRTRFNWPSLVPIAGSWRQDDAH
jgi:hypothetical protein